MDKDVGLNNFDKSKPFYPLILQYLYLVHGIIELSMRSIYLKLESFTQAEQEEVLESNPEYSKLLHNSPTIFLRPISLKSEFQGDSIIVDSNELARDLLENHEYILSHTLRAAGFLLVLSYETTEQYHDKSEIWEFLRHCRNAAAHNGLFTFKYNEPRCEAKWGKFTIEHTLQGQHLFIIRNEPGLISPGDPIRLLWDIEQAYPNMKA